MTVHVADIMKMIEAIAPLNLAEDWDNSGLQVGNRDWEVKKVILALDPTEDVVRYAGSQGADMLITHHPLLFKAVKTIDFSNPTGRIIQLALENRLAVYSAHTNYDCAGKGLNDILAAKLGLKEVTVLCKPAVKKRCKLVFFVPTEQKNRILKALFETTAGIIGDYTCCSFLSPGNGTFRPGSASKPFSGKPGTLECTEEVRIETVVPEEDIESVVNHLKKAHPYETMAYDVYPLIAGDVTAGLGRTGVLPEPLPLSVFAQKVKDVLGAGHVKISGDAEKTVKRVALCTGSGSSLLNDFFSSGADVYLSGDLHYHDARMIEEKGLGMIDAGHFATEILMAQSLRGTLQEASDEKNMTVEFSVCPMEQDPFIII